MRALFSTATSTIAWLGETSSNSDLVYLAIANTRHSLGSSSDETYQALVDLLSRPYWSRVWVIQEFLLPLRLDVWWAGHRVKVHDFCRVLLTTTQRSSYYKPQHPSIWRTPGKVMLRYREHYQRMCISEQHTSPKAFRKKLRLQSLLRAFSASRCTILHDSVYTLLGIASDTTDSSDPILPDYTKSLPELVLDVAKNQYREPSVLQKMSTSGLLHRPDEDRSKQTNNLTTLLCHIMGVSRVELVAHIFHKAPRLEREIYEILSETRIIALLDGLDKVPNFVSHTGGSRLQPSATLRKFASLITQETERLNALQKYLYSQWSYAAYRPCSAASPKALISWLLEFRSTRSNAQSRRH
jgi:hypothetical protein